MGSVMNNRNISARNFGGLGDMRKNQNSMSSRNFKEDLDFPFQSEGPGHGDRDFRTGSAAAAKSSFVIGGHGSMQPDRDFGGNNFGGNNFGAGSSSSLKFGGDSFGNTGRGGGGGQILELGRRRAGP